MIPYKRRASGILLCLLSQLFAVSGFIMLRKSHKDDEARESEQRRPEHHRRLFLFGTFVYIIACVPDLLGCAMLPQVLYSTLGCFRLVLNAVLGQAFLGEKLNRWGLLGIAICSLGTILCVLWGPKPGQSVPSDSNGVSHERIPIYVASAMGVLIIFLIIVHGDSLGCVQTSSRLYKFSLPFVTALALGVEKVFNLELGFMTMPSHVFDARTPRWVAMVAGVAILGLLDFYLNMRAASRMSVHVFVPLSFSFGIAFQVFQGAVVFDEFENLPLQSIAITLGGCCMALFGSLVIQVGSTDVMASDTTESFLNESVSESFYIRKGARSELDMSCTMMSGRNLPISFLAGSAPDAGTRARSESGVIEGHASLRSAHASLRSGGRQMVVDTSLAKPGDGQSLQPVN